MYRFLITLLPIFGVNCASYYPRYDTTGYPSSTISNLNGNFPLKSVSYGSDIANFPEVTRYPNYSPGYGYSSTGYSSYSTSRYPFNSGYSTPGYSSVYNGGSGNLNFNQDARYGSGYGTGYGSSYGSGLGSSYGTGYGSSYGTGLGSSYGSSLGSTYGTGLGSNYATGIGSNYGSSGSSYGGSGSSYGGSGSSYGGSGSSYGRGYGSSYGTGSNGGYSSYEAPFMNNMGGCVNRSPQNRIWVDSIMGMWYGVEYIQHLGADSRVDHIQTCIVIHIAEPKDRPSTDNQLIHVQHLNAKFRQDYRHLRLLWDEAGHTIEYGLYFSNDSAGYWHVYSGQNGTLINRPNYQQFSGTVQVLKAINDQLVLNFCQDSLNGRLPQLYSVLFSRLPGQLNQWEIDSVHSMLQNRKLSTASRRMVCGNGAERRLYSLSLSLLTCFLGYIVGSS